LEPTIAPRVIDFWWLPRERADTLDAYGHQAAFYEHLWAEAYDTSSNLALWYRHNELLLDLLLRDDRAWLEAWVNAHPDTGLQEWINRHG
jgi:hypothetical protein